MKLPTREEINVYNSLDEHSACNNFLGKSLAEVEALLREGYIYPIMDLMWVGPVAFQFYVFAAIKYIQSSEAENDADVINCFLGLLEFRFEYEQESLKPIAEELVKACRFIVEHYGQFEIYPEIYGELRPRYEQLIRQLSLK